MKSKVKAKLFSLEAFLNKDGNVEILYDAVEPEEFEKTMNMGLPMYEGTNKVGDFIRYLRSIAQEVMETLKKYGIDSVEGFGGITHGGGEEDHYGARYGEFLPILIKAVQELSDEVKELKEKN